MAAGELKWHVWWESQPWAGVQLRDEVGDAPCGLRCFSHPGVLVVPLLRTQVPTPFAGRFLPGSKVYLVSLAHHGASRSVQLHGQSPRLFSWRRKSFLQLKPAAARGDLGAGRRSPTTPAHPAAGKPAAAGHGRAVLGLDPPLRRNSPKFSKFQTAACVPLRRREGGFCGAAGLPNRRGSHGAVRQDAAAATAKRCSRSQAASPAPAWALGRAKDVLPPRFLAE